MIEGDLCEGIFPFSCSSSFPFRVKVFLYVSKDKYQNPVLTWTSVTMHCGVCGF